jgi:hypothetical protein
MWLENSGWNNFLISIQKPQGTGNVYSIVDGHSNHVNMSFIELADSLRIILLILLPHTTHRLQPLNIGLFQPLSITYSIALNRVIYESQSFTSMTKQIFWIVFKEAWEAAFTVENIKKLGQRQEFTLLIQVKYLI